MYNKMIFKRNFHYHGIYWYMNLLNIPTYFRQMYFLIKNGYDIAAAWSVDYWFIDTMKLILTELRENKNGYPADLTEEKWTSILTEMIELLSKMDEDKYDWKTVEEMKECCQQMNDSKERFFELFSKHFYHLWD